MYNCDICKTYNTKNKTDLYTHFLSPKHLSNFNKEQRFLIKNLINYIKDGTVSEKEGIRINSGGGTGKTFCVSSVLKHERNIICLAPTNQAVNILNQQGFEAQTFHSFFGWTQEIDENDNEISVWRGVKSHDENSIFIIDEISMMSNDCYSLFDYYIKNKYKYILMGDKYQLPPINSKCNLPTGVPLLLNKEKYSLAFQFDCNEIELYKNMRTKNTKTLEEIEKIRLQIKNNENIELKNNLNKLDFDIFKNYILKNFIMLCQLNRHVDFFNKEIKKTLNPHSNNEFDVGDKIIINKTVNASRKNCGLFFTMEHDSVLLNINSRHTISFINKPETKNVNFQINDKFYEKDFIFQKIELDNKYLVSVSVSTSKYKFNRWISFIRNEIKNMKNFSNTSKFLFNKEKIDLFKILRCIENLNANMKLSFCSTVNKAQGSSYDTVFVYNNGNSFFKNEHKYTMVSRAVDELFVFNNF